MLTWIQDRLGPHVLDAVSIPFRSLVLVDGTAAVVLGIVFGLNLAIVDVVLQLNRLQEILHLLL